MFLIGNEFMHHLLSPPFLYESSSVCSISRERSVAISSTFEGNLYFDIQKLVSINKNETAHIPPEKPTAETRIAINAKSQIVPSSAATNDTVLVSTISYPRPKRHNIDDCVQTGSFNQCRPSYRESIFTGYQAIPLMAQTWVLTACAMIVVLSVPICFSLEERSFSSACVMIPAFIMAGATS